MIHYTMTLLFFNSLSNNIKHRSSSFWVRWYPITLSINLLLFWVRGYPITLSINLLLFGSEDISSGHIKIYISNGRGIYSKKQVIFKLNIYLLFCWFCISLCFSLVLMYIYLFTYFYVFISNNYMQHDVNIECYTSLDIQKRRISINHN